MSGRGNIRPLANCDPALGSIDFARLTILSDADLDRADEEGFLGGNQEYQDLRGLDRDDLAWAIQHEALLVAAVKSASDPAAVEARLYARRSLDDERQSLWHLDLGVAAATVAIAAAGGQPYLSCNGGAYGHPHGCERPQVRFYLQNLDLRRLKAWTEMAGVSLAQLDDVLVLHASEPDRLLAFAQVALGALDGPV
jgi:hypothetical protein